jgi:hypothetical protein
MEYPVKIAKEQLESAMKLGLVGHRKEIELLITNLIRMENDLGDSERRYYSLQNAFDILQGIVADQTSRINALENAISEYLDPSAARLGVEILQTVLVKELGED